MSKTIPGVPESVTREQYLSFFHAAGITPEDTQSLRFLPAGIEAVVFARDAEGRRFLARDVDCSCLPGRGDDVVTDNALCDRPAECQAQHGFAKHTIFIPVATDGKEGA